METPAKNQVHSVNSGERSSGLEETTSNSKAGSLAEKPPGDKAVAGSQHAGHSSSSLPSLKEQGVPQKPGKKPFRRPAPRSSPESGISSKSPRTLNKREAASNQVPQETPEKSSRNTSRSSCPKKPSFRKRKASDDQAASPRDVLEPSSIPHPSLDKAVAGSQHAGHSSSSVPSLKEQGVPQKPRKKPFRIPAPRSSPESAISSKSPRTLNKRKAASNKVPQETPEKSSRNTSLSSCPKKPSFRKRKASDDHAASPRDVPKLSSIPHPPLDDRRKAWAKNEGREENTQHKIPAGPHETDRSAGCSVENKHQNVLINHVEDSEKFFEEWAKHDEYAMCFTVTKTSTEPERNTESSTESTARSSKKHSMKPAQSKESSTIAAFVEGGYRITGIAVSWGNDEAHYVCLDTIDPKKLSEQLARKRNVIVPDVHRAFTFLARPCNLNPANCGWTEPKLASWLLDPDNKKTDIRNLIQRCSEHLIPILEEVEGFCSPPQDITKKGSKKASKKDAGTGKKKKAMADADARLNDMESSEGAGRLAVLLWYWHKALVKKLEEKHMDVVYKNHMVPALGVHSKILLNGIGFLPDDTLTAVSRAMMMLKEAVLYGCDKEYHLNKKKDVETIVRKKVASLIVRNLMEWKMEGNDSLKELSRMLTDAGQPDFASKILDWRKLNRIHSMLVSLKKDKVRKLESHQNDGTILHMICPLGASWTVTGRAMSIEPSLQFINNNIEVCTEPRQTIKARAAFRPSSGAVLLSADYSQLEMRVLAHLSQDKKLCEIFRKGGDVFRTMAALWNDKDKKIDDTLRDQTKKICYGILYGQGQKSLADELGVPESQVEKMMTGFQKSFPDVSTYRKDLVDEAKVTCEVQTLLGRSRRLPDLKSNENKKRRTAERQVFNTKIQGSAADIFFKALLAIDEALCKRFGRELLRSGQQQKGGPYMVLQMHDEVLLDVQEGDVEEVSKIVRNCMEGVKETLELKVPFPVCIRKGASWADMEDI